MIKHLVFLTLTCFASKGLTMPEFKYSEPTAETRATLKDFGFSTAEIAKLSTDLEKARAVMSWSHRQWRHDGANDPGTTDPRTILLKAKAGQQFRCVEFSVMVAAAARAIGLGGRVVGLRRADVETAEMGAGHVVGEIYLPDMKKWVMADAQFNFIPISNGKPLSVPEFAAKFDGKKPVEVAKEIKFMAGDGAIATNPEYFEWVAPYMYYVSIRLDQRLEVNPRSFDHAVIIPAGAKVPTKFQRQPILGKLIPEYDRHTFDSPPKI